MYLHCEVLTDGRSSRHFDVGTLADLCSDLLAESRGIVSEYGGLMTGAGDGEARTRPAQKEYLDYHPDFG
jgi:hypothetical protein